MERLKDLFPEFYRLLEEGKGNPIENVLPAATEDEVRAIEERLGLLLPLSYKEFLLCTRGFWLRGGVVAFGEEMPFFHDFPPLATLTAKQQEMVRRKGGSWPPPSQGMLCFAEYWLEADGDQVLFDVARGLRDGEYPVMYYAHEEYPPSAEQVADSFGEWLEKLLTDETFDLDDSEDIPNSEPAP
ncbi:MAG TPA: SMI1/KNR4 family protein [Thermomicrobiales bacterium]|nr:SMI1/KNR4 family protein [Thermomicrobiales bacterium]